MLKCSSKPSHCIASHQLAILILLYISADSERHLKYEIGNIFWLFELLLQRSPALHAIPKLIDLIDEMKVIVKYLMRNWSLSGFKIMNLCLIDPHGTCPMTSCELFFFPAHFCFTLTPNMHIHVANVSR